MFKRCEDYRGYMQWEYVEELSNGQKLKFNIYRKWAQKKDRTIGYFVEIYIQKKKRRDNDGIFIKNESTGINTGIEALSLAKTLIEIFEDGDGKRASREDKRLGYKKSYMVIKGTDARRDRVYKRLVKTNGYVEYIKGGQFKALIKELV